MLSNMNGLERTPSSLSEMPGRVDCPPSHFVCGEVHPSEEGEPDGRGFIQHPATTPENWGQGDQVI